MSFKAQYHGTCSDDRCQGHITPGDEVQYSIDGLVHIECPGAEFDLKPTETVCTLCWMVQPCSCEDD